MLELIKVKNRMLRELYGINDNHQHLFALLTTWKKSFDNYLRSTEIKVVVDPRQLAKYTQNQNPQSSQGISTAAGSAIDPVVVHTPTFSMDLSTEKNAWVDGSALPDYGIPAYKMQLDNVTGESLLTLIQANYENKDRIVSESQIEDLRQLAYNESRNKPYTDPDTMLKSLYRYAHNDWKIEDLPHLLSATNDLAMANMTSTEDATKMLDATLSAYFAKASEADDYAGMLSYANANSRMDVAELATASNHLGRQASKAGWNYEHVLSSLMTLNDNGYTTTASTRALEAVMKDWLSLSSTQKKAQGVEHITEMDQLIQHLNGQLNKGELKNDPVKQRQYLEQRYGKLNGDALHTLISNESTVKQKSENLINYKGEAKKTSEFFDESQSGKVLGFENEIKITKKDIANINYDSFFSQFLRNATANLQALTSEGKGLLGKGVLTDSLLVLSQNILGFVSGRKDMLIKPEEDGGKECSCCCDKKDDDDDKDKKKKKEQPDPKMSPTLAMAAALASYWALVKEPNAATEGVPAGGVDTMPTPSDPTPAPVSEELPWWRRIGAAFNRSMELQGEAHLLRAQGTMELNKSIGEIYTNPVMWAAVGKFSGEAAKNSLKRPSPGGLAIAGLAGLLYLGSSWMANDVLAQPTPEKAATTIKPSSNSSRWQPLGPNLSSGTAENSYTLPGFGVRKTFPFVPGAATTSSMPSTVQANSNATINLNVNGYIDQNMINMIKDFTKQEFDKLFSSFTRQINEKTPQPGVKSPASSTQGQGGMMPY
ncbi:phage tail tape measure protein [Paenibacillus assamensis]|uniref:phage tail tape measure protein n=1 Tax=Paenibacillus assamensis TaxID=311244 RepID=UPI000405AB07|nr:phage tail tape measure protein [Paenibacillus assamensis]